MKDQNKRCKCVIDTIDLTVEELQQLCDTAIDIDKNPQKYQSACAHKKLATLFFEPSTRTRLSFEAAMHELGGAVISVSGAASASTAKGESMADTAKVVSRYADIIAMRSPQEGAALVAAKNACIPVINAGDGGHCHPTQTTADLLTIYRQKGSFDNLTIGLCGDLLYGRTVHSLMHAMSRYKNNKFVCIAPDELKLPKYVQQQSNANCIYTSNLEQAIPDLDVLYMTRIQRERFDDASQYERLKDSYVLNAQKMQLAKQNCIVLHPLPRVNEISTDFDADPRAVYFDQTENGKLMRMALILHLLKAAEQNTPDITRKQEQPTDKICTNNKCISQTEQEIPRLSYTDSRNKERCIYCDKSL